MRKVLEAHAPCGHTIATALHTYEYKVPDYGKKLKLGWVRDQSWANSPRRPLLGKNLGWDPLGKLINYLLQGNVTKVGQIPPGDPYSGKI